MATLEISTRKTNGIVISNPVFENLTLTATGAETWPKGAVLARVTASGKYVRFDPGGAGGAEVPKVVLTQEVEFAAAGDRVERPAISGEVRRNDLVDVNDTALTDVAVEQLRDFTILALDVTQLSEFDNQ